MIGKIDKFFLKKETKKKEKQPRQKRRKSYHFKPEGVTLGSITPIKRLPEFKLRKTAGRGVKELKLKDGDQTYDLLKKLYPQDLAQEYFIVFFLSKSGEIIGYSKHSIGTTNSTSVDVKLITAQALKSLSEGVIVSHNHPSEVARPSEADRKITAKLRQALDLFNIVLVDHLIYTDRHGYYSFFEQGEKSLTQPAIEIKTC